MHSAPAEAAKAAATTPAAILQAVSDPIRLRILRLTAAEELAVQELARILGIAQPRVSKHLAVLRDAGWVRQRREGTWSWCRAAPRGEFPGGESLHAGVLAAAARVPEAAGDDLNLASVLRERDARSRHFFRDAAARWDEIRRSFDLPEIHLGVLGALIAPGRLVADIGAGTGALLPLLAGVRCRVIAIDNSEAMLARARALCRDAGMAEVAFQRADVQELPLRCGACDAAVASMVLHHVARPARAMAELARIVRPGGRVVLIDFAPHDHAWLREELAHQWLGFSQSEIERRFAEAGLTPVSFALHPGRGPAWLQAPRPAAAEDAARRSGRAAAWPALFVAIAERPARAPGTRGGASPNHDHQPEDA